MTTSMRMDEDQNHVSERILDLTLEIIYLLTGEQPSSQDITHLSASTSLPDNREREQAEGPRSHPEDDGAADRRGSYKVSGCHCLFLHGGVGVFRRTQGSLQGCHDGQSAAPHITGLIQ
ncbi:unnamed protein product [Staurois parvus]|uniref:Uncharacterized protein n=1 Tax=Staurois parvus TaxID=386267 RepID=A0ABN9DNT8_9NEOB|nr:unnamed protein product [Staurois parvus]